MSDEYFETLGTPLLAGRDFNSHDTSTSAKVAIVSRCSSLRNTLALRILSASISALQGSLGLEIVGIVKDARYGSLREEPAPFVFIPWSQGGPAGPLTGFELRAVVGAPTTLTSAVKSAIARVNPAVSMEFKTLSTKVDDSIQRETLLEGYPASSAPWRFCWPPSDSTASCRTTRRRRRNEIGIRMALGAEGSLACCGWCSARSRF